MCVCVKHMCCVSSFTVPKWCLYPFFFLHRDLGVFKLKSPCQNAVLLLIFRLLKINWSKCEFLVTVRKTLMLRERLGQLVL